MSAKQGEDQLALYRRRVERGERRCEREAAVIFRLNQDGRDTRDAEALLETFLAFLAEDRAHLKELLGRASGNGTERS